jgi:hypothetical protein
MVGEAYLRAAFFFLAKVRSIVLIIACCLLLNV